MKAEETQNIPQPENEEKPVVSSTATRAAALKGLRVKTHIKAGPDGSGGGGSSGGPGPMSRR
jgi:hypothetical protein